MSIHRRKIVWRDHAKAQLRAIEQGTALRILHALAHFATTGEGDGHTLYITAVKHRREAYR